jgi:amidase
VPGELTRLSACDAVALLRSGDLGPSELVEAALERIEETDAALNAMPTVCAERARAHARRIEAGESPGGRLGGLPIAVKDLNDVAGVRTTYGSPIYADHIPERSDLLVERLEANGAIVIGKSNTPEFGAGANTYNEVFGDTRNPWDTALTCGGSSGGSASALASGQVWLATGSDLAGSLRTPASFCGVVGLRPSPGRVASGPGDLPFDTLGVEGPMGRTVADAALMLDALAGADPRDPLSFDAPSRAFLDAARDARPPRTVAFSPDLGYAQVDADVAQVCADAADRFAELGATVRRASPGLVGAPQTFQVLRAAGFVASLVPLYETDRDRLKPEIRWNVERGLAQSPTEVAQAERDRGRIAHAMATFLGEVDVLACPAAPVPPFPVERRWVEELEGERFDNYVEWLRITSAITLTACPAIVLPCGLTRDGLPVGLQLVGRPRGEAALLSAAAAFEGLVGFASRVPRDPATTD